ncbi:MAG: glutamate-5-semialdehyde dehydrogenase [Candidatus Margulisiibacteriota bacterium]
MKTVLEQCQLAFEASKSLRSLGANQKEAGLTAMAAALLEHQEAILLANNLDIEEGKSKGHSEALLDRLMLNPSRLKAIADSILDIRDLPDPIGEIMGGWKRPNGLQILKVRVPMGVVGMIYEARPNVTADAAALTLKTNNAAVLRGSSTAYRSNRAIVDALRSALFETGINPDCLQLLEDTRRESVVEFSRMNGLLDVIIPRGGADLIQNVIKQATVPVIETGVGNCHVYVDESADLEKAIAIVLNGKTQRPSVCNALETVLIHQSIASRFLPTLVAALKEQGVTIRACDRSRALDVSLEPATEEDWKTEYLDLIIAIKIVDSVNKAIAHIDRYGTRHTEAILSKNLDSIEQFKNQVDAAAVMVNASTRFTDGGEFGFGAEIGISTQKLHARGPMGITEMTTYKYIVEGQGQIR